MYQIFTNDYDIKTYRIIHLFNVLHFDLSCVCMCVCALCVHTTEHKQRSGGYLKESVQLCGFRG